MRIIITIFFTFLTSTSFAQHVIDDSPYKSGAHFPGGMDSLSNYLATNIKYPPYLKRTKGVLEEVVEVEFTVTRAGWIDNIRVRKGKNKAFRKEAARLVKAMPKWKPAEMEGKVVNETITLPIHFRYENEG